MATLLQARVVVGVGVHALLHHVLQPREPGGLKEATLLPLLRVGALLQNVVETLLLLLVAWGTDGRRLDPQMERHVAEGPAL